MKISFNTVQLEDVVDENLCLNPFDRRIIYLLRFELFILSKDEQNYEA